MHLTLLVDPTTEDPKVVPSHDLIFLHGLTGNSETTWTAPGRTKSWLETLLAPAFPKMNIWLCDWDWTTPNTIEDLAGAFVKRLGNSTKRRPAFIVAHDIGCLIAAKAVLMLQEADDECWYMRTIARGLIGLLMMDGPFHGGISNLNRVRTQMQPADLGIPQPNPNNIDHGPIPDKSYTDLWIQGNPVTKQITEEYIDHILDLQKWDRVRGFSLACSTRPEEHREMVLHWPYEPREMVWRYISVYASHTGMTRLIDGNERVWSYLRTEIQSQIWNHEALGDFHFFFNRDHLREELGTGVGNPGQEYKQLPENERSPSVLTDLKFLDQYKRKKTTK